MAAFGPKPKNTDFPLLKVLRTPRTIGAAHVLAAPGRSAVLRISTVRSTQSQLPLIFGKGGFHVAVRNEGLP